MSGGGPEAAQAALRRLLAQAETAGAAAGNGSVAGSESGAAGGRVGGAGDARGVGRGEPAAACCPAECDPLVHQLVFACLACEAGDAAATEAVAAVRGAFVDYNELRVASASDIAGVIGRKSVVAERRASWVRAALRGVFDRSNALTLEDVRDGGKRGARQSIEKLGELPAYVVARVCLHGLGAHAFPVDERLSRLLAAHGVVGAGMGAAEASAVVERLVRAGEAAGAHLALEAAAAGLKGEGSARGARGTAGTREGRGVKSASAADTKEQPGSARRPGSTREKTGAPRRGSGRAS